MNMNFKQISVSLGQQGGIGNLPRLIKIDKWYAISDSRYAESSIWFWENTENDSTHSQSWALRKFRELPQITQEEAEEKMRNFLLFQGWGT